MPDSRPLPIRVLIKGASLMHAISERPQQREHAVFGRVLEESLLDSGHAVDVWTAAVASQPLAHAFATWEREIKAWAPDVVVLSYGYYEAMHLFLPRWLERHAHSLRARPGTVRTWYRQMLLRPVWKSLARVQMRLDRVVGARGFGRSVRRFEKLLASYVDRTREVGQPLIVLIEFLPPGDRGQSWFPGMAARAELMNAALRRAVARYDSPDVVLLSVPDIAAENLAEGEPPNTDGFHYTGRLHRFVGEALADLIRDWVKDQPRFAPR